MLRAVENIQSRSRAIERDEKMFAEKGYYTKLGPDILNKLRPLTIPQRITNQSFCSNGQRKVKIKEFLSSSGTCFTINHDDNLMNLEE